MANPTLDNLLLARERLTAFLAAEYLNPMPDYDLDEQEFEWGQNRANLIKELAEINKLIQMFGKVRVHWLGRDRTEELT